MGAWIETVNTARQYESSLQSHPMWVRGLKHILSRSVRANFVAPHVGAWIETSSVSPPTMKMIVAPHVGAWIET